MISRLLTRSMMGIALLLRFLFGLLPPRDDRIIDRTFLADRNGFSRLKKLPLLDPSFRQSLNSLLKLFKRARSKFSIISRKKLEQMTTVTISLSPRGMKKNWVARREKQPISPPEPVFFSKIELFFPLFKKANNQIIKNKNLCKKKTWLRAMNLMKSFRTLTQVFYTVCRAQSLFCLCPYI